MTAHVNAIRMIAFGRYAVDLVGREEFRATYEFDVVLEPIPTIVWSDAFEDERFLLEERRVSRDRRRDRLEVRERQLGDGHPSDRDHSDQNEAKPIRPREPS